MATKQIKPIFGGAYEATEDGEIYSLKRKERRLMVGVVKASGYRMVVITVGRKKQYHNVHRLIAETFIPNPKNYREVNHKDGNKLNNAVANLEWVTASQNQLHAVTSGLRPSLKLNYEKASEIRELYASGNYTLMTKICENCGRPFQADTRNVARGWGKCCSKSCAAYLREKTGTADPNIGRKPRITFDEMLARANAEPTKRKPRHIESHIQRNCLTWFRLQYPELRLVLFAIPNGGARNKREAGILKAEGVTAGVADMILLTPSGSYGALCIEFKTEDGSQRQSQKEWQKAAETAGNKYVIVRSIEDFIREINTYLRPA